MTLNIAVCDNDLIIHELLRQYIARFRFDNNISHTVSYFSNGSELLSAYAGGCSYDMIITDIEMPGPNGIDTAEQIRNLYDKNVMIIFLTSYPRPTHGSFRIQLHRYWVKPLSFDSFKEQMETIVSEITNSEKIIRLPGENGRSFMLKVRDIIYVEFLHKEHCLIFHTVSSSYTAKENLSDYRNSLNAFRFISLSRTLSVNIRHIRSFHKNILELSNGRTVQLTGKKEKELKQRFSEYMLML